MKSFLKYFLATVAGIFVSSIILIFVFFGMIGAAVSSAEKPVKLEENTILVLDLDKNIVDRKPSMPFDFKSFSRDESIGLNEILAKIKKAKEDVNIDGIYFETSMLPAGTATIDEIREALIDFRESGKFVVCYSDIYTQRSYFLASAADKVYYNPVGFFSFHGLRAQTTHFKSALQKLKIEPTVIKRHEYKSFGEAVETDGMSDYNREQIGKIINTAWDDIIGKIGESRGISKDTLNLIADELLINEPKDALKYGMVDSLIYKDDVIKYLKSKTGVEEKDDLKTIKLSDYKKVSKHKPSKKKEDKIAVIYASGGIVGGEGDENQIGAKRFERAIRKARKDSTVKAVVLRVNSGGGSAIASEAILAEMKLTKEVKPVVVSMGDVAASGGYYISCAADEIFVGPNTITGSIGVIGVIWNAQDFFNHYGVTFDVEKTNKHADIMTSVRPLDSDELAYWNHSIDVFYDKFLKHVAEGRGMEKEEVHEIAKGRVWIGKDAIDIGLADKVGGLTAAVKSAKELAGIQTYKIAEYPEQKDPIEQLIKDLTGQAQMKSVLKEFGTEGQAIYELTEMYENQGIVARMPFILDIR